MSGAVSITDDEFYVPIDSSVISVSGWRSTGCAHPTAYQSSVAMMNPAVAHSRAMQRQPTPKKDPTRPGHFLRRKDALHLADNDTKALEDLCGLPSMNNEKLKKSAEWKALKAMDVARASELNLRSFDTKKVKNVLICYNCHKARCFFAKESNDEYAEASEALKLKMEDM